MIKSQTPEYKAWTRMKQRCSNPDFHLYKSYGGRGIKVCKRWLESFSNFFEDMGIRPSDAHSLNRINNDGNYEPENCEWATREQQCNNRQSTRFVIYKGRRQSISQWAHELGYSQSCLRYRILKIKLSPELALTLPPDVGGRYVKR